MTRDEADVYARRVLRSQIAALIRERDAARAALAEACKLLAIDASYADEPNVAIGLRLHARDCAKFLIRIKEQP